MDLSLLFWIVVGIVFIVVPFAAALGINEIIGNLMNPPKPPKAKTSSTPQENAEIEASVLKMIRKAKMLRAQGSSTMSPAYRSMRTKALAEESR